MYEKECVAIAKIEMPGRCNHAGVERHTNTRGWAETTKHVQKVTEEGPMSIAKKEMSAICNHAAVNTHTRAGSEDETRGESSRRRSHVNTRVGDADTHVTVWAGKSV